MVKPVSEPNVVGNEDAGFDQSECSRTSGDLREEAALNKKHFEAYPMLCFCDSRPQSYDKPCWGVRNGHRGKLPGRSILMWCGPWMPWYALKYHKAGYMKKFFIDDYPEASLGIIAFSSVLSVLVDAFTDPKMATLTDTYKSKYGRRRPFIFFSAFFVPIVFLLHWTPFFVPSGLGASLWFGFFHVMTKLCDTVLCIPLDAWGTQLTPNYKEQTRVWMWKTITMNVGIIFGMAVLPLMFVTKQCTSTVDTGCWEHPLIAIIFGVVHVITSLWLFYAGKEPAHEHVEATNKSRKSYEEHSTEGRKFLDEDPIPCLIATYLNQPFRCLLVSSIIAAVGQDVPLNILPFMTAWLIGEKCLSSGPYFGFCVFAYIIGSAFSIPIYAKISNRFGKYNCALVYTVAMFIAMSLFAAGGTDTGDCFNTYLVMGCVFVWGMAQGGHFVFKALICDLVDYDELLSGGQRREASYVMAYEFVPKFVSIPGECVPFLLMAYAQYLRPLTSELRPICGSFMDNATHTADGFCAKHYSNEPAQANWCSTSKTCAGYLADGATFVCNHANEECGFQQNDNVKLVLRLCFSLVPAVCILFSFIALFYYPKRARHQADHEALIRAIHEMRQGSTVEDPWNPGVYLQPASQPGPNAGSLAYFWPSELRSLLKSGSAANFDIHQLKRQPLLWAIIYAIAIPIGVGFIFKGLDDMADGLGASVSPLGLMLSGIGIVGVWFHGLRFTAAVDLCIHQVDRAEVLEKYLQLCPFLGQSNIEGGYKEPSQAKNKVAPLDPDGELYPSEGSRPSNAGLPVVELRVTAAVAAPGASSD